MIEEKKRVRKVRKDRKRDVKPTVSLTLYECIDRLSYITSTPMKEVAEYLCIRGLQSRKIIEALSTRFRRNYQFHSTLYIGDLTIVPERTQKNMGLKRRLSIRFPQSVHDQIGDLAYAMDVTISTATAILLETSVKNAEFLDTYITKHVTSALDPARKKQLQEVLAYIRKDNPYAEEITLARLVSYILEEVKDQTIQAKRAVENWLDGIVVKKK